MREPQGATPRQDPGQEFLASNFFIDWDNAGGEERTRRRRSAGLPATATAWDKAKAVERWVHANMQAVEFSQAMATASQRGEDAERRLHRVRDVRGGDVPGDRRAVAGRRSGLVYAPGRRRQAVPGVPHVVRGVTPAAMGGARRDARPRRRSARGT